MNMLKTSLLASAIAFAFSASAVHADDRSGEIKSEKVEAKNDMKPARTAAQATTDAAITASVKTRLLADDRTEGFDINVETHNGVVTLTGGADTQADKMAATEVANNADNVVRVDNKLTVASEGTKTRRSANTATTSGELRAAVTPEADHDDMDHDDMDHDGMDHDGELGDGIDQDNVDYDGELGDGIDQDNVDMERPDAWITAKVKTQLLADDLVKGMDINVDTRDHVVMLIGTAPTAAARNRAVEIAQGTEGVRSVVATKLIVGPDEAMDEDDVEDRNDAID